MCFACAAGFAYNAAAVGTLYLAGLGPNILPVPAQGPAADCALARVTSVQALASDATVFCGRRL
jgi:hypothetical protein